MIVETPPLPDRKHQFSRIPRPPPPRKAVMSEDVKDSGLPTILGHVLSHARVVPEDNSESGSTHYGRNTKRASPSYMRKPSKVVLPPLQKTQYHPKQSSSNGVSYHQVSKQTTVFGREVEAIGSIKREQELKLPMIPQPPSKINKNNNNASVRSRIPRLPTIQQNQGVVSGIQRPPQQPRSHPGGSHRKYVAREAGIQFPRRQ